MTDKIKLAFPKSKFVINEDGSYTVNLFLRKFIDREIHHTNFRDQILITYFYKGACEEPKNNDYSFRITSAEDRPQLVANLKSTIQLMVDWIQIELGTKIEIVVPEAELDDYVESILIGSGLKK